jgi:hypothetical protein
MENEKFWGRIIVLELLDGLLFQLDLVDIPALVLSRFLEVALGFRNLIFRSFEQRRLQEERVLVGLLALDESLRLVLSQDAAGILHGDVEMRQQPIQLRLFRADWLVRRVQQRVGGLAALRDPSLDGDAVSVDVWLEGLEVRQGRVSTGCCKT